MMTYPPEPHELKAAGHDDDEPIAWVVFIGSILGVIATFALVLKWSLT